MMDAYPQFENLKLKLEDRLTERGLNKVTEAKLEATEKSLEEERRRFLKNNILHNIVTDISMDPTCSMRSEIAQKLTTAELSGFLNLGRVGDDTVSTLGLQQSDFPKQNLSPEFRKVLRESIEERLFDETKSLYLVLSQNHEPESRRNLLHPHLVRLHDKIADLVTSHQQNEAELRSINSTLSQAISKQRIVLAEMSEKLDILINKYYAGTKLEATSVQVQYTRAKCENIRLKLKNLEFEITNATYTKDAVKAIKVVKSEVSAKLERAQSELSALENTISQYREVGTEFSDIVIEYSNILKQIQDKKWALQELSCPAL